jgi:2-iminobutanoate/2-iminopropanoate deaminase
MISSKAVYWQTIHSYKEVIMSRTVVHTENAPKAIGPYSQAIRTDLAVYTAGQLGVNPSTGDLVSNDIEQQTRQALQNLQNVLQAGGSSLANVVKTTVFLQDMNDFTMMNGVYAEFFTTNPPARSTIQVAALPKGALVEIEAVALLD